MVYRVVNIIEEARLGGPQVRIANVACALKNRVETTVVMPVLNSERFCNKLDECGVTYKKFRLSRITKDFRVALRYIFFSVFEVIQLVRYFRKEQFDLVHVSGGAWQYKGVIAGKLSGRKVVWHLNDTSMPFILRKVFSILSVLPDAFIFASERTKEYYSSLIKKNKLEFVIPAPVDTDFFSPKLPIVGDDRLIASWRNKIVVGTVSNLSPVKGLDVFVDVASSLNKKFSNIQFVVVGLVDSKRSIYKTLMKKIKDLNVTNISFIGQRDDVRALLGRFDLYLSTSYTESSPISIWEAMSMGKTIVSTDVGDVARYVISGQSGEILKIGDVDGLVNAIENLLTNKKRMFEYAKRSREIAVDKLDISKCIDLHEHAYNKILNS